MKLSKVCFHNCYYEKFGNNEPVKIDDLPFNIPDSWMWIRLGMSCKLIGTGIEFFKGEKQYYSTGSIKENNFVPEGSYNFHNRPSRANRIAVMGELIDAKMQNTVKVQIIDNRLAGSLLSTGFYVLKNYINNIEYIKFLILSNYFQKSKDKKCSGTTQKAITDEELSSIIIPLPPLEEQQRIVDKINSFEPLLEKYDKVEKELSKLEKEFPEKLKRSILQYAIEGKLVNQDPDDEPASVLLERIKQEKERLIKEGKIKRDKNESNIYQGDDKNYYEQLPVIPINWIYTDLGSLGTLTRGNGIKRNETTKNGYPCVRYGELYTTYKTLFYKAESFISFNLFNKSKKIRKNDIIMALTGENKEDISKAVAYLGNEELAMGGDMTCFSNHMLEPLYLVYVLNSPYGISRKRELATGDIIIHMSNDKLSSIQIPLPPLREQMRIIYKIDTINRLID